MDFYNSTDMTLTEIAEALADFTYGSSAKIYIPALLPLVDVTEKPTSSTRFINIKKIANKNPNDLDIGKVIARNYIMLQVPVEMCPKCKGVGYTLEEQILRVKLDTGIINFPVLKKKPCKHEGKKGQKFIINFAGGNINNPAIFRRYDG